MAVLSALLVEGNSCPQSWLEVPKCPRLLRRSSASYQQNNAKSKIRAR